mgnify:CR=1 FL=1|tara:strand:- start:274 stop:504 length:231 start_codon:yes stop_codon:yes gene_type:complete
MSKNSRPNKHVKLDLTIGGKRQLIQLVGKKLGDKKFCYWLKQRGIPSQRYLLENVRKYKASFFRDLFTLFKITESS